jgi:hypothetical protein
METINYTTQAQNFAKTHGIKLKVLNRDFGFMPWDDKKGRCRWIFRLRLTRNGKQYSFTFGQSRAQGENDPTIYDVLACLTKYEPGTFNNFCADYGYDNNSIKAFKTYKAVCREFNAVNRLFGDILEELQEIQ